jgi:hypothetical protein
MATPTPKKTTINGKTFQLNRLRIWDSAEVQAYIAANIAPIFAGQSVVPGNMAAANLFILKKVLAPVLWYPEGAEIEEITPRQLNTDAAIEDAFAFDMETMYSLVWEQMEYNRFPFFEKAKALLDKAKEAAKNSPASGAGTKATGGSGLPTPNVPGTSKGLET